jgi:hypothetical protein
MVVSSDGEQWDYGVTVEKTRRAMARRSGMHERLAKAREQADGSNGKE